MKNVYEVLRQKELKISKLKKEVEALRVAAPLLAEGEEAGLDNKPSLGGPTPVNAAPQPDHSGWEDRVKRWP